MLDAILTISGLTLFYSSALNSWSTSLNLLFFYITWSTLLLAHTPLRIELLGTLISRFIFFWLPALFFYLLDTALPSVTSELKTLAGTNARQYPRSVGWKGAVRVSSGMPLPGGIVWDLVRGLVSKEILQYYLHRCVLHSTPGMHTRWQHADPIPPPLWPALAHYDHPLPYLVYRFIPVYAPAAYFRFHALTFFTFIAIVSLEEALTHTGYGKLFFSGLLSGAGRRSAVHFASGGRGNYSTWGVLDWLHGTMVGVGGGRTGGKTGRKVAGGVKEKT
ncbi:hypothetical protein C7212DRAFT_174006 [Tuber magnatum]|uniref:Fatty acid hydroxylase domain-containing protein n=1 Tax=Tuber magnatum TaxID=42249 RepID=A0A317SSI6_9PEZI|nr:hypothetical protein C7212DRAFT_174006 [Tuber magnatum]